MILPVLKTFTLTRNVTFDYRFQWLQGVPPSAVPQNLTNWTGVLTITDWQGVNTLMTLRTGAVRGATGIYLGGTQADPTNGIIDIIIQNIDSANITWPSARYTFDLTEPNGVTNYNLLYGQFVVFGFQPS